MTQIVVEYNGVDDGRGRSEDFKRKFAFSNFSKIATPLTSMLRRAYQ